MIAEHVSIHRFKREISLHHIAIVAIETVGFQKRHDTVFEPFGIGSPGYRNLDAYYNDRYLVDNSHGLNRKMGKCIVNG